MMRKVLQEMRKGVVDINAVARDLDIGKGTLEAILEIATRKGYVKKVSVTSSCGACYLSGACKVEPSECDKMEMYIVTQKGEKYACENE